MTEQTKFPKPSLVVADIEFDDEALATYKSWEDEEQVVDPKVPLPTCKIDHERAVRMTNRFLHQVERDPATFLARFRPEEFLHDEV